MLGKTFPYFTILFKCELCFGLFTLRLNVLATGGLKGELYRKAALLTVVL